MLMDLFFMSIHSGLDSLPFVLSCYVHLDGYRTVADKNTDKKQKTQKVKSKALTVDAKKHLASVRVIQKNLVYIIGLPANLGNKSENYILYIWILFSYVTSKFCKSK
jgi:hypothetical protein